MTANVRRVLLIPQDGDGGGAGAETTQDDAPQDSFPATRQTGDSQPQAADDHRPGSSPAGEDQPSAFESALSALEPEEEGEGSPLPGEANTDGADATGADKDGQAQAKSTPEDVHSQNQEQAFTKAFDQRPEWKGVLSLSGQNAEKVKPLLRQIYQRETALAEQMDQIKPMAEVGERLRRAANDDTVANNAVALVERWFAGDAAALTMLDELKADLQRRLGVVVSSPDLLERSKTIDRKVNDGLIDEETAAEHRALVLETEKARAQAKQATGRVQQTEAAQQGQAIEKLIAARTESLNDWEKNGPLKNPDYAGRPELQTRVLNDAKILVVQREYELGRMLNAGEMVESAKQAYDGVMNLVRSLQPKPTRQRAISGNGSSATAAVRPRNFEEAVNRAEQVL